MPFQINKLIEHINQLVIWLKDNPNTPIPSSEKNRLVSILTKIKDNEELSQEEWEKLKPNKEHKPENAYSNLFHKLNQTIKPKIKKQKDRFEVVNPSSFFTRADGKLMFTCIHCNSNILASNAESHRTKCSGRFKPFIKRKNDKTQSLKNVDKKNDPVLKDYKTEKNLDGSYGYHQFRENGRFGSHPSFDNMNDQSTP